MDIFHKMIFQSIEKKKKKKKNGNKKNKMQVKYCIENIRFIIIF